MRDNGLSLVLVGLFVAFWAGQSLIGHRQFNEEQREHGAPVEPYGSYLRSAHFWEATAENWESEFFQMFGYVFLTTLLFQRGRPSPRIRTRRSRWTGILGRARPLRMPLGRCVGEACSSPCTSIP